MVGLIYYISFLLNPLYGFVVSLVKYSEKHTKNIIWLFTIIYGYTFVISNDTMDANRRRDWYELITSQKLNVYETLQYFYLDNDNATDFIEPIIYALSSFVFSKFNGLMMVLGIIFGFYYSRVIDYIFKISKFNDASYYSFIFLSTVPFIIGFWQINMFRFYFCAILFLHALLPYFYEKNKKKLIYLIVIPFVHFSFFIPIFVFIVYYLLGNKTKVYVVFLILAFFLSFIDIGIFNSIFKLFLPGNFHSKIDDYTDPNYQIEVLGAAKNWAYYIKRLFYYILIFLLLKFYKEKRGVIANDKQLNGVFNFTLLFFGISVFLINIPSGDRYIQCVSLFSISFICVYLSKYKIPYFLKLTNIILTPIIFIFVLAFIRDSFNTLNSDFFYNNTILLLFINSKKAIVEIF